MLALIFPNQIKSNFFTNMWNSYLYLVTNDDHCPSVTNYVFNTLLYNHLVISWAIIDIQYSKTLWCMASLGDNYYYYYYGTAYF